MFHSPNCESWHQRNLCFLFLIFFQYCFFPRNAILPAKFSTFIVLLFYPFNKPRVRTRGEEESMCQFHPVLRSIFKGIECKLVVLLVRERYSLNNRATGEGPWPQAGIRYAREICRGAFQSHFQFSPGFFIKADPPTACGIDGRNSTEGGRRNSSRSRLTSSRGDVLVLRAARGIGPPSRC